MPDCHRAVARRRGVAAGLALATLLACAGSPEIRPEDPAMRPIEVEIVRLINDHRRSRSLPPLREASRLGDLARGHSGTLARQGGHIDHAGFQRRFRAASAEIPLVGFSENVARMGKRRSRPASWVVTGWLDSEVHRKNIEGQFDLTGVGVVRAANGNLYFTQLFAKIADR